MKVLILLFLTYTTVLFSQDAMKNRLGEREKEIKIEVLGDPVLFTLEKDLGNVQDVLIELLRENDHYNIPFKSPIVYPRWQYVGGPMLSLDVGADGSLFSLSANQKVFRYLDDKFLGFWGRVSQISVGSKKHVCAIGPGNNIFKIYKKKWVGLKGRAKYVSCGSDGTLVAIHTDIDAQKFNLKNGSLIIRKNRKWKNLPGTLEMVSVGSKNNIWGIKSSGSVWFFNGKIWDRKPGNMEYISAAFDGTVAAVGKNGGAYLWNGLDWVNVPGVNLVLISVSSNGNYWGITDDGSIWKSLKE